MVRDYSLECGKSNLPLFLCGFRSVFIVFKTEGVERH